jgi:nuclear pore complex protein Nup205
MTIEFDNADALQKYYDLMLSVLRVINAAVITRGRQNEQTVFQARQFLKDNRSCMVSIFKRSVNVGVGKAIEEDLTDLVDCFTVLVDFTGFLEVSRHLERQYLLFPRAHG